MKLKIVCIIIIGLFCNISYGMMRRAPTVRARARMVAPRCSFVGSCDLEIVPFKVVPPAHLKIKVERALASMNIDDIRSFKELNAVIKEHAFDGENDQSRKLLKDKTPVERSLILDQVDMLRKRSLLIKAANIGYLTFMDFLLHHGANAAIADTHGETALTINPLRLTPEIVEQLLDKGASCTAQDNLKRNVLHYLAMNPEGFPLHRVSSSGENYSVFHETNGKVARRLIPEGANMYALDVYNKTPIDLALETDHIEVLKAFIDCGANAEAILAKASPKILMDLEQHCAKY